MTTTITDAARPEADAQNTVRKPLLQPRLPGAIRADEVPTGELSDWQIARMLFRKAADFGVPLTISTLARVLGNCLRIAFFVLAAYTALNFQWSLVWWLFGIVFARAVASYVEHFAGHWVAFSSLASLRIDLYRALTPQAPGLAARVRAADVATVGGRDIDRIEVFYAHTLVPVAATILTIPLVSFAAWYISGPTALVVLAWMIISALLAPWAWTRSGTLATRESTRAQGALAADVAGYVTALPLLKLLPGRSAVTDRIAQRAVATYQGAAQALRCDTRRYLLGWVIDIIGVLAVLATAFVTLGNALYGGGSWLLQQQLPLVQVLALTGVGSAATIGVTMCLRDTAPDLIVAFASARRLFTLIAAPVRRRDLDSQTGGNSSEVAAIPGAKPVAISAPGDNQITVRAVTGADICAPGEPVDSSASTPGEIAVVLRDVSFAYPDGRAVGPFNMRIVRGQHVLIEGPSGAGKSTIAGIIAGVNRPQHGRVEVLGADAWSEAGADPLTQVTMIEQNPYVFADSVAANLRIANPSASDAQLWDVLEAVALADFVRELGGLEARIGERGSTLSGGQRQRLALARGFLRDTPIYLLDEVGANLDEDTYAFVRAQLSERLRGKTVIEISHRLHAKE